MLTGAVKCAAELGGWTTLTRKKIADCIGVSEALSSRYLGTMENTRRLIMAEAKATGNKSIIMQSIVAHDGYAMPKCATIARREKALNELLGI